MLTLNSLYHTLKGTITQLCDLVSPPCCILCGGRIHQREQLLCARCQIEAPFTRFTHIKENPMQQRAATLLPHIEHVSALVYYSSESVWRDTIHRLKYANEHYLGRHLGMLLGRELASSPLYRDIDFVISVPLHPLRRIYRGYNQSYYIAKAVARELRVPLRTNLLRRSKYNVSQTNVNRERRWDNTRGIFKVIKPEMFRERSVLIVDDVFTTGATTISCAETIIDAAPSCRVYIASVAVSEREFGVC